MTMLPLASNRLKQFLKLRNGRSRGPAWPDRTVKMRGDAILIASSFVFCFVFSKITYLRPMPNGQHFRNLWATWKNSAGSECTRTMLPFSLSQDWLSQSLNFAYTGMTKEGLTAKICARKDYCQWLGTGWNWIIWEGLCYNWWAQDNAWKSRY